MRISFQMLNFLTCKFHTQYSDIPKQFLRKFCYETNGILLYEQYFCTHFNHDPFIQQHDFLDSFSSIIISPPKLKILRKFKVYNKSRLTK